MKKMLIIGILLTSTIAFAEKAEYYRGEAVLQTLNEKKILLALDLEDSGDGSADMIFTLDVTPGQWKGPETEYSYDAVVIYRKHHLEVRFDDHDQSFFFEYKDRAKEDRTGKDNTTPVLGIGITEFREGFDVNTTKLALYTGFNAIQDFCRNLTCGSGSSSCSISCSEFSKCRQDSCSVQMTACCKCLYVERNGNLIAVPCCGCVNP